VSKTGRKPRVFSGSREWLVSGLAVGALGLMGGFIAVPILALVVWTVSEEAWGAMASPAAHDALLLSLKTTAATMIILVVVGTPAAYVLARGRFWGSRALNTLVELPIVLPPSAAGIALLLAFGRFGLAGQYLNAFGVTLSFTTVAVVMAQVFVAAPFYLRQAATGFAEVDRAIEEAALVDGADRTATFFKVTVPLAFPALVAGAVTIIFAGNFRGITQTIPLAIYSEFQSNIDAAVALSVLVLGFAFAVILTVRYLTSKATEYSD
jgi:molybdate transport system permease protein